MKTTGNNLVSSSSSFSSSSSVFEDGSRTRTRTRTTTRRIAAFTLIELILVLALLVIITSLAAPAMSRFVRGRALDSEARRLAALMHAGQSRAVSEGSPMMLWVDEKAGTYGLEAETSGANGDAKAENLTVDSTLILAVAGAVAATPVTFKDLPAIKFLADGTVDENSPPTLKLTDSAGFSRWLMEATNHNGYEIRGTEK